MEPVVLPGKFPNLLINGGIGIAVGMATSLPPHNPTEIFDAIIRVARQPEDHAPGADDRRAGAPTARSFATASRVRTSPPAASSTASRGIVEAYATGRGKVSVRGEVPPRDDQERARADRHRLASRTCSSRTRLVERIVDAVKEERIVDVSDVRNESGREAQTRIVIELKKGADPAWSRSSSTSSRRSSRPSRSSTSRW
jgi:DNA gyrase subunit A